MRSLHWLAVLALWPALTAQTATLIKNIHPTNTSRPEHWVDLNGIAYFAADDGTHGSELWRSDGTESGTWMVKDIAPGGAFASPFSLAAFGAELLFAANDGVHGHELWITDGTAAGTRLVADIYDGPTASLPGYFIQLGPRAVFVASDRLGGEEPWVTDGTAAGTLQLRNIRHDSFGSMPREFTSYRGRLYFRATNSTHGEELWVTDGTPAGTQRLTDLTPGPGGSALGDLAVFGDRLVFRADDGVHGSEPWISDGTTSGTQLLKDIIAGSAGSSPSGFTEGLGRLFFAASEPATGIELYTSDGTAAGTRLFADLWPGPEHGWPSAFTPVGDFVVFRAAKPQSIGRELWTTDGTLAGTKMLNVMSIPVPSYADRLTRVGSRFVYFHTILDDMHRTDGTQDGTRYVTIVRNHGPQAKPVLSGSQLVFSAALGGFDSEPYHLELGAVSQPVGVSYAPPGRDPRLQATDPVIGQWMRFDLDRALPGQFALLLASLPAAPTAFDGAFAYVDVTTAVSIGGLLVGARGTASTSIWLAPELSVLDGVTFCAQAVLAPSSTPLRLDATNGVRWTLGN